MNMHFLILEAMLLATKSLWLIFEAETAQESSLVSSVPTVMSSNRVGLGSILLLPISNLASARSFLHPSDASGLEKRRRSSEGALSRASQWLRLRRLVFCWKGSWEGNHLVRKKATRKGKGCRCWPVHTGDGKKWRTCVAWHGRGRDWESMVR